MAQTEASVCNAGDLGSIPRSGRSPGEGNGNHSSTLARKIPWMEEPDRLHPMESQSRTQLSDFTSLHFSGVREWLYCKADWASCFSLRLTGTIPAFLCSAFSVSSNDPSYIFPTLSVPVQMTSQQPLDCQQAYYAQSPYSRMYLP